MQKDNIFSRTPREYGEVYSHWQEDSTKELTIYTEPVAKGRPRFTRQGHAYTPQKTADYEDLIRRCWQLAYGKDIATGYIKMALDFYVPIPKSMTKADKQKAVDQELRPDKRPDIDNYVKAVMDALNEMAYWDDKQIVSLRANKWYSTEPRVEIRIKELPGRK